MGISDRRLMVVAKTSLLTILLLMLLPNWNPSVHATGYLPSVALPGCQEDCGNGVRIPYPFGIGENCSYTIDFSLACLNQSPVFHDPDTPYEITSISLHTREVRVLMGFPQTCNHSNSTTSQIASRYSFPTATSISYYFSYTKNKLTSVGCNAFGALSMDTGPSFSRTRALGCLATCESRADKVLADDTCSGFGCCQTSLPPGQMYLDLTFSKISNDTFPWLIDRYDEYLDESRSCGYVFLVEAAEYTFKKSHLSWRGEQRLPVVLDWFIWSFGATCEEAQRQASRYACKSQNSVCNDTTTNIVRYYDFKERYYFCLCAQGYEGNPYLENGCRDIDECEDPVRYPCSGICINTPGGYECRLSTKSHTHTATARSKVAPQNHAVGWSSAPNIHCS